MSTMMQCGHAANATKADGSPVCIICLGITEGADVPAAAHDLSGRTARCSYGDHKDVLSSTGLAFFEHRPDREFDSYYCGCRGWN